MASCRMCRSERYAEICWKHLLDRLNVSYGELHHFFGPGVEESWVRMPWAPVSGANKMDQRRGRSIVVSKVLGANWHTSPPTSFIGWVPARDLLLVFIESLPLYIEDFASIILLNLPISPSPMLRWFELLYLLCLPKFAKNIQFANVTYCHTISPHMHPCRVWYLADLIALSFRSRGMVGHQWQWRGLKGWAGHQGMPKRKDVQFGLVYFCIFECLLNSRSQTPQNGKRRINL